MKAQQFTYKLNNIAELDAWNNKAQQAQHSKVEMTMEQKTQPPKCGQRRVRYRSRAARLCAMFFYFNCPMYLDMNPIYLFIRIHTANLEMKH